MKRDWIAAVIAVLILCVSAHAATLTIEASSGGTVEETSKVVSAGDAANVTAEAGFGYNFDSWTVSKNPGNCKISNDYSASTTVIVNGNCTVTANFSLIPYVTPVSAENAVEYNLRPDQSLIALADESADGSNVIRFSTNTPSEGWYCLEFGMSSVNSLYLSDFGADDQYLDVNNSKSFVEYHLPENLRKRCFQGDGLHYWSVSGVKANVYQYVTIRLVQTETTTITIRDSFSYYNPGLVLLFNGDTLQWKTYPVLDVPKGVPLPIESFTSPYYNYPEWSLSQGDACSISPPSIYFIFSPVIYFQGSCGLSGKFGFSSNKDRYAITNVVVEPASEDTVCVKFDLSYNQGGYMPWAVYEAFKLDVYSRESSDLLPYFYVENNPEDAVSTVLVVDEGDDGWVGFRSINLINTFINGMLDGDKVAIVGYRGDGSAVLHQSLTSDKMALYNMTYRLMTVGTSSDLGMGVDLGLKQLMDVPGRKSMIVFTSGNADLKFSSRNDVVSRAKAMDVSISVVAKKLGSADALKSLADDTDGTYTLFDIESFNSGSLYGRFFSLATEAFDRARFFKRLTEKACMVADDGVMNGGNYRINVRQEGDYMKDPVTGYFHLMDWTEPLWREPDAKDTVKLYDAREVGDITRATDSLLIQVNTQNFSDDSIRPIVEIPVLLTCLNSRDHETATVSHVQDGLYQVVGFPKREGFAKMDNGILECFSEDSIVADFKDPIYETVASDTVYFADKDAYVDPVIVEHDGGLPNGASILTYSDGTKFEILIHGYSESLYEVDTLMVLAYTDQGDSLWMKAIETGAYTSEFKLTGEFVVVNDSAKMRSDHLEGLLGKGADGGQWRVNLELHSLGMTGYPLGGFTVESRYEPAVLTVINADGKDKPILRTTEKLQLDLTASEYAEAGDKVVSVRCLNSGDAEQLLLTKTETLVKDEHKPVSGDGVLSCAAEDEIVVEYVDPLYEKSVVWSRGFKDEVETSYAFTNESAADSLDGYDADFTLSFTAVSPSLYEVDTVKVLLFTDRGDSLWVDAVETGAYTSEFVAQGSFNFVVDSSSARDDALDCVMDLDQDRNRVVIRAQFGNDSLAMDERDSLVVSVSYIPADFAEIYDKDQDGRADFVRVHFAKSISRENIFIDSVFWNGSRDSWRVVRHGSENAVGDRWIEAALDEPFDYGMTEAMSGSKNSQAYVRISRLSSSTKQKVPLRDSVGAVPVAAIKHPGVMDAESYMEGGIKKPQDTLYVSLSEPLKLPLDSLDWKNLFALSEKCSDKNSEVLRLDGKPSVDKSGREWKLVLSRERIVKVGGCLRLNPMIGGVKISGDDGDAYLYEIAADPAVATLQTGSAVRTKARLGYTANVTIFDNIGNVVTFFKYKSSAMDDRIPWDLRTDDGVLVGSGVYIWKIRFRFTDGHKETRIVRTGVNRRNN
ncbi:MAG: hypothetical protein MJZ25_02345 [Fibrobacter sp.]|nr:hypothetical protein [Fibrobacter sp.]